jgi:general secretion pathway protein E
MVYGNGTLKENYMLSSNAEKIDDSIWPIADRRKPVIDPEHIEKLENNPQLQTLRDRGVAAFKNGTLYVGIAYAADAGVVSFAAYCKRQKIPITQQLVDVQVVHNINSNTSISAKADSRDSQAIQTFHEIIRQAVDVSASDIHIIIKGKSTTIKQRIHGDLRQTGTLTRQDGITLCTSIYQSLTDAADPHYIESRQQDARIPSDYLPVAVRDKVNGIRIATTPLQNGSLMVLRILYETGIESVGGLMDLGYRSDQAATIENMEHYSTGINIVVGPTGSGKSTTLKMILTELNEYYEGRIHILTVEDPPEYPIAGVNQIPVTNVEGTEDRREAFNGVVRGSMRLDPDTIMIGEIRDSVTADLALNAAMTGHRVWTTLHANTALGAIQRLVVLGLDVNLLAERSVFRGVISQRLIKKLCPHCRVPLEKAANEPFWKRIESSGLEARLRPISSPDASIYFTGPGCNECNNTGTAGRTVVAEIINATDELMELILQRNWMAARKCWLKSGGLSMMAHAIEKIQAGLVDPRAVEDVLDPIYIEVA